MRVSCRRGLVARRRRPGRPSRWRPARRGVGPHSALLALCNFGLFFPLLVVAVYRLPGGVAAAAGGLQPLLVAGLSWLARRPSPAAARARRRRRGRVGVALVVVRPGAGPRRRRRARRRRRQRLVRRRRRADEALPGAAEPARRDRLAAAASAASLLVPLAAARRGADRRRRRRRAPRRVRLPRASSATGARVRGVVRRDPPPADRRTAAARPRRARSPARLLGWVVLGQSLSPVQLAGFVVTLGAIAYGAVLAGAGGGVSWAPATSATTAVRPAPRRHRWRRSRGARRGRGERGRRRLEVGGRARVVGDRQGVGQQRAPEPAALCGPVTPRSPTGTSAARRGGGRPSAPTSRTGGRGRARGPPRRRCRVTAQNAASRCWPGASHNAAASAPAASGTIVDAPRGR